MPRGPRLQASGVLYHVIARGNNKEAIFLEPRDHRYYLTLLARYQKRFHFQLYAFALMTNHLHLLLEQAEAPLSQIMQCVHTTYAAYCNRKYGRVGHLFQDRYHSLPCEKESHLLELSRYIHLNPVRAGLVVHPASYPWSSYRMYIGSESMPFVNTDFILEIMDGSGMESCRRYKEFVESALEDPSVFEQALGNDQGLASNPVVERLQAQAAACKKKSPVAITSGNDSSTHQPLSQLITMVAEAYRLNPARLLSGSRLRPVARARAIALYIAREVYRCPASALASEFQISLPAVSKAVERVSGWMYEDAEVRRGVEAVSMNLRKS